METLFVYMVESRSRHTLRTSENRISNVSSMIKGFNDPIKKREGSGGRSHTHTKSKHNDTPS